MTAYRYSINGEHGGMVFANNKEEAEGKLIEFYKRDIINSNIEIWKWEDDDFYKPVPDVYDCY